jgi:hypothetical protein
MVVLSKGFELASTRQRVGRRVFWASLAFAGVIVQGLEARVLGSSGVGDESLGFQQYFARVGVAQCFVVR